MSDPGIADVAYLGPAHTNTHDAALRMFPDARNHTPFPTKTGVFEAVAARLCHIGVVPIENSTEGVVRETVDCLIRMSPVICREFEMPIHHCLMGLAGMVPAQATRVLSHPQALAQCRQWLDTHLPNVPRQAVTSTAAAALRVAEEPRNLAIATRLAASHSALELYAEHIADRSDNATRFIAIANSDAQPTGHDKTSLVFTAPHERGALVAVLLLLDEAGINMSRIESRPLRDAGKRWQYAFVVDVDGHRDRSPLKAALQSMAERGCLLRVLGSYPR